MFENTIKKETLNSIDEHTLISGYTGSGETTIAKNLIDSFLKETNNDILVLSFESEYNYLKKGVYPQERIQVINMTLNAEKDYTNELMLVSSIIKRNRNQQSLTIVIDGVDYLNEKSYRIFLDNLTYARAYKVSIVATTSENLNEENYGTILNK